MKRREFVAAASAAGAATLPSPTQGGIACPVRAVPRVKAMHLGPKRRYGYVLLSDGPKYPRPLIRPEVLDKAFGKGTYQVLTQPDHWAMIDAGWFGGEDLFEIVDPYSREFRIWGAYYRPECEAHDLLMALFSDRADGILEDSIPELGLTFAEHPYTPRLATVCIAKKENLGGLISAVSARTGWLVVDPENQMRC